MLLQHKQVVEYKVPKPIFGMLKKDYARLHTEVKEVCGDIPYYFNMHSSSIYTVQPKGKPMIVKLGGNPLALQVFTQYPAAKSAHYWIKALTADFFYATGRVNNNIFYLVIDSNTSKKGHNYLTVIKLDLKHHHQITDRYELLVNDYVTRMKGITKADYTNPQNARFLKGKVPYSVKLIGDKSVLRQLSTSQLKGLKNTDLIFIEDTDKDHRSQVKYHSINSVNKHEQTRSYHLSGFIEDFLSYLRSYQIVVDQKTLDVWEQQDKNKSAQLTLQNFAITLVDGRLNRSKVTLQDFTRRIDNIKEVKNHQITQISIDTKDYTIGETKFGNANPMLFLMDYREDDFGSPQQNNNIPLDNTQYTDLYKKFKAEAFVQRCASQAWCINENYQERQENIKKATRGIKPLKAWTDKSYLDYKGLEKKEFVSQYEVCIQQLYLKNLLKNPKQMSTRMPHYDLLKGKVFAVRQRDQDNNRPTNMLYIENNELKVETWNDQALARITGRQGGITEIDSKRLNYHQYHKSADFQNFKLIISKDYVWEIQELDERALYDEKQVSKVLQNREAVYPKAKFMSWNQATADFSKPQIQAFHAFIRDEVKELRKISYYELRENKTYWNRIKEIFGISKEDKFRDFLKNYCGIDLQGKKSGSLFKIYEGIWHDINNNQYFVGAKGGYKYNQDKGVRMRKVIEIEGNMVPEEFFPLLDVEFIRYGGYTVLPFPFSIMGIEA